MAFRQFIKQKIQSALETFFDNTGTSYESNNVQGALEEIGLSASPGFSFGRSGNLSPNTWLKCETVSSNRAGRWVYIDNAEITEVFIGNEDIDTFDLAIYHHDGDAINLTLVGSVSVVAARGGKFSVSFPVPTDKQIAVRIENGSAKNTVVGLQLKGTS